MIEQRKRGTPFAALSVKLKVRPRTQQSHNGTGFVVFGVETIMMMIAMMISGSGSDGGERSSPPRG